MDVTRKAIISLVVLAALCGAFASSALALECANEAIRVEQHATRLPECRAWEMVSSSNKENGEVFFTMNMGGISLNALAGPSANGEELMYSSFQGWGENASGIVDSYIAKRTADGWQSEDVSPSPTEAHPDMFSGHAAILDATPEFSHLISAFDFSLNPLDQNASQESAFEGNDVYMREPDGSWVWVSRANGETPSAQSESEAEYPTYAGRSANAGDVLFETTQKLVPEDDEQEAGKALYDRVQGSRTELVNVNGGGTLLNRCGAVIGGLKETNEAVSEDGSHVYFTAPDPTQEFTPLPSCEEPAQVYLRDGDETLDVSRSQRTVEDPNGTKPASFEGATADGERAFFTSGQALTDEAQPVGTGSEPFLYEFDVQAKQLRLLTPNLEGGGSPNVKRVLAISNDGNEVYFLAEPDVNGKLEPQLDVSENGQVTEIGAMPEQEFGQTAEKQDTEIQARLSADGRHLAFADGAQLTGFDNYGVPEIYLYGATDRSIQCVSCNSDGHVPYGPASLSENAGGSGGLRYPISVNLNADGSKVFFETPDSLLAEDDNQAMDVYEWDQGSVQLLSGGQGETGSYLIGTADEGRDVFFTTTAGLAPQDTDNGDNDAYDARVEGGFPGSPGSGGCASGCQVGVTSSPLLSAPGSASIGFDGNLKPVKAKPKKKHKVKEHKVKKHKGKRHKAGKKRRKARPDAKRHGKKHASPSAGKSRATGHRDAPASGR